MNKQKSVILEVDEVTRGIMDALENQLVMGISTAIYQGIEAVSDEIKSVQEKVGLGVKEVAGRIKSLENNAEQLSSQLQTNFEHMEKIRAEASKEIEQVSINVNSEISKTSFLVRSELENMQEKNETKLDEVRMEMDANMSNILSRLDKQSQLIATMLANQETILTINGQLTEIGDRLGTLEREIIWLNLPFYRKIGRKRKGLKA